jgi:threonine/homoserine/homoserine lactone efflux protein
LHLEEDSGNPMSIQTVSLAQLLALLIASLVVMGSPGPATMSVTAVGAAFGLRRSLQYLAGIVLGTIAVLLAVAAGLVAALLSVPSLASVLVAGSAIYILWLAFRIATAPPLSKAMTVTAPTFAGGFLLAVANPKAYVAIAAVFAGSTLAPGAPGLDAGLKIAVLSAMIVVIHIGWLLAGVAFSRVLYDPVSSRIANVLFAAALVVTTVVAVLA